MNVLLSIKPKYVEEIRNGKKKYEFRKKFLNQNYINKVENVYIYSSAPIKKIVAKFTIEKIFEEHPEILWNRFRNFAGVNKTEFFNYFQNRESGIAIKMTNLEFFKKPIEPYSTIPNFRPPQSYRYLEDLTTKY